MLTQTCSADFSDAESHRQHGRLEQRVVDLSVYALN